MPQGDALEAEQMALLISGFFAGAVKRLEEEVLKVPVTLEPVEAGLLRFQASGMLVTVRIDVALLDSENDG